MAGAADRSSGLIQRMKYQRRMVYSGNISLAYPAGNPLISESKIINDSIFMAFTAKLFGNGTGGSIVTAAGIARKNQNIHKVLTLYYRVVVFRAPLQGLCYTVRDAVDWCCPPTTRWF